MKVEPAIWAELNKHTRAFLLTYKEELKPSTAAMSTAAANRQVAARNVRYVSFGKAPWIGAVPSPVDSAETYIHLSARLALTRP